MKIDWKDEDEDIFDSVVVNRELDSNQIKKNDLYDKNMMNNEFQDWVNWTLIEMKKMKMKWKRECKWLNSYQAWIWFT
jgi:hypothetical protein